MDFYPKEKDASGKNIVVRKELEEHIRTHLLRHIQDEKRLEHTFRARPLFDRLHARIGIAIVLAAYAAIPIGICLLILSALFHVYLFAAVATSAVFVVGILFGFYLLMPPLRALLRKCNLWKDTR